MSITTLVRNPHVQVVDGSVVFSDFCSTDRSVVETIGAATDPEACAHQLLHLGARLSGLAAGTAGLGELETRVGARLEVLTDTAQASVAGAVSALAEHSRALFASPDGEVRAALGAWKDELGRNLGEMFDPDHKRSVIATMEVALRDVLDAYARRLAASTDPDEPASSAGRLLAQVRQHSDELKAELRCLTLAVGTERGRTAEHVRSAVKGNEFEPVVVDALIGIAAPNGDLVEHVGTASGAKGTKKGDVVVTICEEDVAGGVGRYVVEAKDTRLSLAGAWRELDAAMANREADAAILVFADADLAPVRLPFVYNGERAIVTLDRNDPDPAALALACVWARWVVRRRMAPSAPGPNPQRMAAAIERGQRSLARISTIRRNLSAATKGLGDAREQLDELGVEARAVLAELSAELAG